MKELKTEEEARKYFNEKIKVEWTKMKRAKPVEEIDLREQRDPYYKMLKRDPVIKSRLSN